MRQAGTIRSIYGLAVISQPGESHMAKAPKQLDTLFHDTLKDIYFAEKNSPTASTIPSRSRLAAQAR
jgi:hypothetical protein